MWKHTLQTQQVWRQSAGFAVSVSVVVGVAVTAIWCLQYRRWNFNEVSKGFLFKKRKSYPFLHRSDFTAPMVEVLVRAAFQSEGVGLVFTLAREMLNLAHIKSLKGKW
eukprot:GHVU01096394.1.p2 GENE.GHVU01096394.1~~GHVU01096394.1.p2  ORF type:complete len:108 (+),score=3.35 GHVU01096394.1:53-376(+)